eukprot:PhM_4_TR7590/c0_g1_i1/m.83188/K06883/K06883; uncharacterized protein
MPFGQLVFGPAGAGKTTYCGGMCSYLNQLGRHVAVISLDPANPMDASLLPYPCYASVRELVDQRLVAESEHLGPNGALMWSMEHLAANLDWLGTTISHLRDKGLYDKAYFLFDCPGQVELYTHHDAVQRIVRYLEDVCDIRLCAVHLVDSVCCTSFDNFLSSALVSMTTMMHFELPHVNVLTKADLLPQYGPLELTREDFSECLDLQCMARRCKSTSPLTIRLCDLLDSFGLVSYLMLDINSKSAMQDVVSAVDAAIGYSPVV